MTITSSSFANVNVGSVPNDGTGDPLRTSFIKLNENFQYINEKIWPNLLVDPPSLTADLVSSYISQFNLIQASQILVTQNEGTITANIITANSITANTITNANITTNTLVADSINGRIGTQEANIAYFTNVWANGLGTFSNITVNSTIYSNNVITNYLGSAVDTFAYLNTASAGNINVSNILYVGGNIKGNTFSTVVSNVRFYQYSAGVNLNANLTGTVTIDLAPLTSNTQIVAMNFGNATANVLTVAYGSIVKGTQRTLIFQNNTNSIATRYIVLPNSFNNKGTANITIPGAANAMFQFSALDSDSANVFCFIANS